MKLHCWTWELRLSFRNLWIGCHWRRYPCAIDMRFNPLPCISLNVYVQWHPSFDGDSVKPLVKRTVDNFPGPWSVDADPCNREEFRKALEERNQKIEDWVRGN